MLLILHLNVIDILKFGRLLVNSFSPEEFFYFILLFFFANSVDPDEMAHNVQSHQKLHCLPFCYDFD